MAVWSGRVANGNKDAEQLDSDNSINLTGGALDCGRDLIGLLYSPTVPRAATINNAYLEFVSSAGDSLDCYLLIDGEDVDSAADFVATTNNISSRTGTSANATYTPGGWVTDGVYQLGDSLKNVIQEIVDRAGWAEGNQMLLRVHDWGNASLGRRRPKSYDANASQAPLLYIDYTATNVVLDGNVGVATVVTLAGEIVPGPASIAGAVGVATVVTLQGDITENIKLEGNVGVATVTTLAGDIVPGPASIAGTVGVATVVTLQGRIHYNLTADRVGVAGGGALVDIYR